MIYMEMHHRMMKYMNKKQERRQQEKNIMRQEMFMMGK